MKKLAILLLFAIFINTNGTAVAGPFYFGANAGLEHSKNDLKYGIISQLYNENLTVWGVSFGANLNDSFRAEMAYNHKNGKEEIFDFRNDSGQIYPGDTKEKIDQQTLLFNLFFYPFQNLQFKPFIGAGIGLGWVDIEKIDNYQKIAYAGYVGVDYELTSNLVATILGTYNSTASYKYFDSTQNWGVSIGARYYF